MGTFCSKCSVEASELVSSERLSIYDLARQSVELTQNPSKQQYRDSTPGHQHLLYKNQKARPFSSKQSTADTENSNPTHLFSYNLPIRPFEEGISGRHIFLIRYPKHMPIVLNGEICVQGGGLGQEQAPLVSNKVTQLNESVEALALQELPSVDQLFSHATMMVEPKRKGTINRTSKIKYCGTRHL